MLKKVITSEGIDGPITEEYMFHISKTDLLEMDLEESGQLFIRLKRLIKEEDNREIYKFFKEFVLRAVGKKSEDGRKLVKTQTIRDEFGSSDAFSELIVGFLEDADSAGRFIAGVVPRGTGTPEQTASATAVSTEPITATAQAASPRVLTRIEMQEMDGDELRSGLATGKFILGKDPVLEG